MDGRKLRRSDNYVRGCWIEVTRAGTTARKAFYDLGVVEQVSGACLRYRSSDGGRKYTQAWYATVVPSPLEIKRECEIIQGEWSDAEREYRTTTAPQPFELPTAPSTILVTEESI